ncbi:hypothetical protein [Undibacterium pigrum]|uniref:Uncharacterized protein n=1 Tax=Undibacterium pigrum TaxID=401470 RepID=A0A318JC32_9BURK|nr:hypothetical protein [Undibacterium pigrum]PXX44276.1 hypothetical protein DFR42_103546 [Undibacterium pigrum]
MSSDLDIQNTMDAGKRNLDTKELIQNWCGHARVEKYGGIGLIEIETGLPIGHHSMACDHASANGMATWLLEDSAIHFHDTHCVGCSQRLPIRLPNISKLIARRDNEVENARIHDEALKKQQQISYDSRCSVRAALRAVSSVTVATFVDDLQAFDEIRDNATALRLIESVRLAPELLTLEVAEHLFSLIESDEHWFDEVGLTILGTSKLYLARLARCTMRCLIEGRVPDLAAEIATSNVSYVEAIDVCGSVLSLALIASPPRSSFNSDDQKNENPYPLRCIFERFPLEVSEGIEELLSASHPFHVSMGALAIISLAPNHPDLLASMRRSLITRLTRADILIDVRRDSELRNVVHDLSQAQVHVFISAPDSTDIELMRYFEGASKEGESRLSGVYEKVISQAKRRRGDKEGTKTIPLNACSVALRRLVALAGTSDNEDVIQVILGTLRHESDYLAPLACEQMDTLLGAAALADSKLETFNERSSIIFSQNLLTALEKDSRRRSFWYLRASFVRWAINGAASGASGLASFTDFLSKSDSLSEGFRAAIIEELPPLMKTGAGLSAVLPFFYAAMVGKSNLIRAASARAIKEIGSDRFKELPDLVTEAFLLMLFDPYVIVHKSAARALQYVSLPEHARSQALNALDNLIVVYRRDQDEEFLLTCIDVYASLKSKDKQFKNSSGKILVAILKEIKPELLLTHSHSWLLKSFSEVEGYAELVFGLFEHCDSD